MAFEREGGGSADDFDAWCRARGRAYRWQKHDCYEP
jgi:hypothetical protein